MKPFSWDFARKQGDEGGGIYSSSHKHGQNRVLEDEFSLQNGYLRIPRLLEKEYYMWMSIFLIELTVNWQWEGNRRWPRSNCYSQSMTALEDDPLGILFNILKTKTSIHIGCQRYMWKDDGRKWSVALVLVLFGYGWTLMLPAGVKRPDVSSFMATWELLVDVTLHASRYMSLGWELLVIYIHACL